MKPLFSNDSMLRRVHREGVLLLGGGRALLLQIAHPSVAAGVAEHSSFRSRRTDRLLRTLRTTLAIVFGSREQALEAAARINGLHRRVAGDGYTARDPELLLWVLATLIDTSLVMYERFVGPLTSGQAEAYYQDQRRVGVLLGLPLECSPPDLAAFRVYWESALEQLEVGDTSRAVAADIFGAAPGMAPVMWLVRQFTAGLLPSRLRAEFGLGWGPLREGALSGSAALSRALLPLLPAPLRSPPALLMPRRKPRHTGRVRERVMSPRS